MQCRLARLALVERGLETLGPERSAALERHLRTCSECGAEARLGECLDANLALLRGEAPFQVDVTARVMARVTELGRPSADEMPLSRWVVAAVAAVFCGIVILGALWDLLPGLAEPARNALALMSGARGVAASLAAPVLALLAIPFKLLGSLFSSLRAMTPVLELLAPVAVALAALAMGTMSTTVVYFVGRDLKTRPLREEP